MQVIEAQVLDATHLELTSPVQAPSGSRVVVSIATHEIGREHQEWVQTSLQRLQSAYGRDEPGYSVAKIRIHNPEFEP